MRGETAHETKQKGRGRADRVGTAIKGRGRGKVSGEREPPGDSVVLEVMWVWVVVVCDVDTHILSRGGSEVCVEAENEATGVTEGITHGMGWRGG